jgi:hypothetical protein
MNKIILDDALRAKLDLENGPAELCDAAGKPVAVVLAAEEYNNILYAWAHAAASTPEAEADRQIAWEQHLRGESLSSAQLFAEIEAFVRKRAAS